MAQLAIGVAYWILLKHAQLPARGPAPVVAAAVLINVRVIGAGLGPVVGQAGLWIAGRLAELAAVLFFAANAWPRIKEFGRGRG